MYQLRNYNSKELSEIWSGYLETETHIVWLPSGGGEPFVLQK